MEVAASLSQGRTAAAQCGLFTHKSVPVIFEPPCICIEIRKMSSERGADSNEEITNSGTGVHSIARSRNVLAI